jgi:hypothetical protein
VTAIGVLSICIASLSLLANCAWGTEFGIFYFMSQTFNSLSQNVKTPAQSPQTTTQPSSAPSTSLSAEQVHAILTRVNALAGNAINQAQLDTLKKALEAPGEQIILPATSTPAVISQINAVNVDSSGTIDLWTANANVTLQPSGSISTIVTSGSGFNVHSSFQANTPFPFQSSDMVPTLILSVLELLLAGYLLTIGILTVRGSAFGGRLHKIYAWVKIILAICGGIAVTWLFSSITGAVQTGVPQTPFILGGIFSALIGIIYPVGLLIALRSRTLRAYYGAAAF